MLQSDIDDEIPFDDYDFEEDDDPICDPNEDEDFDYEDQHELDEDAWERECIRHELFD